MRGLLCLHFLGSAVQCSWFKVKVEKPNTNSNQILSKPQSATAQSCLFPGAIWALRRQRWGWSGKGFCPGTSLCWGSAGKTLGWAKLWGLLAISQYQSPDTDTSVQTPCMARASVHSNQCQSDQIMLIFHLQLNLLTHCSFQTKYHIG